MRTFLVIVVVNLLLFGLTPFWTCGKEDSNPEPNPPMERQTPNEPTQTIEPDTSETAHTEPIPDPLSRFERTPGPEPFAERPSPNQPYPTPDQPPSGAARLTMAFPTPFKVPADQAPRAQCMVLEAKNAAPRFIQRLEAQITTDAAPVIERILLYIDTTGKSGVRDCTKEALTHTNTQLLYVWRPGMGAFQFPDESGIQVPANVNIGMSIHYQNNTGKELEDKSGITLYHAATAKKKYRLWHTPFTKQSIRKGRNESQSNTCEVSKPVALLASAPWLQSYGRSFITELFRTSGFRDELIFFQSWDPAKEQRWYKAPLVLGTGDKLVTSCTWRNTGTSNVSLGWGPGDESCVFMAYIDADQAPTTQALCKGEVVAP